MAVRRGVGAGRARPIVGAIAVLTVRVGRERRMTAPASAHFPWSQVPEPPPGERRTGRMQWPEPDLGGASLPYIAVRGGESGPALVVSALGHPSYSATHGILRFAGVLDAHRLRGSLMLLPGGLPAGSDPEALRARLWSDVVEPAEALISLEGPPPERVTAGHTIWYRAAAAVDDQAADMAEVLGARYVLGRQLPARPSMLAEQAAASGKPALQAVIADDLERREEQLEETFVGIINVLRVLGMLDGRVTESATERVELIGIAQAPVGGLWTPTVRPGQRVRVNDALGIMQEPTGTDLGRLVATHAGTVLSYTRAVAVREGDELVCLVRGAGE